MSLTIKQKRGIIRKEIRNNIYVWNKIEMEHEDEKEILYIWIHGNPFSH